ncbi:MAG: transcriptional regulator [Bacteroidales bacterium]|nr:transcriptional regulator [Bacteroidales bacterium]
MKKIEAIIRKSKFKEVKKALIDNKIRNFSYWLVRDVGETSEKRVYRGVEYEPSASERICVTFVIKDDQTKVLDIFTDAGITGEDSDSRVIIYDIQSVYELITQGGKDIAIRKM